MIAQGTESNLKGKLRRCGALTRRVALDPQPDHYERVNDFSLNCLGVMPVHRLNACVNALASA